MYKSFYNLARNPFDLTPDPTCFVPTVRHNEALAALYYGIRRHKGVVVVTGEVGTGKTLMLRCLLQLFKESSEIAYAYLFNCRLSSHEFLHYTAADFGLKVDEHQSKGTLLLELSRYVTSRGLQGLTTVLVIDEAHNLSTDLLEEIRLLSNLETNDDKLLQIVLVGQPELDLKLDSFELRPLKQRIALRAHLTPLDEADTDRYIVERLTIAGGSVRPSPLFSPEAVKVIHQYSKGFPRLINTICENSLITGYAQQLQIIPAEVVLGVAKDFHLSANGSKLAKGMSEEQDMDRAKSFFLDIYASQRNGGASPDVSSTPIAVEAGDHESNI
ncbi:MAG TPA: AAA family ATPase [Terracidiphilus sp.]|jgi:general secretion pathway protein A